MEAASSLPAENFLSEAEFINSKAFLLTSSTKSGLNLYAYTYKYFLFCTFIKFYIIMIVLYDYKLPDAELEHPNFSIDMITSPKSLHASSMNVQIIQLIYSRTSALTSKRQNSQLKEILS